MGIIKYLRNNNTDPLNKFTWRKFPLKSLFDIVLSDGDNQAKLLEEGDIPLVSAGASNNGICKYIKTGDGISHIFDGNVITIDMFGKAFYQPHKFYAVSHGRVNILKPLENGEYELKLNKYIAMFLITVMEERFRDDYSYGEMCNNTSLSKEEIYLPINCNGLPDWDVMEKYIKELYTTAESLII